MTFSFLLNAKNKSTKIVFLKINHLKMNSVNKPCVCLSSGISSPSSRAEKKTDYMSTCLLFFLSSCLTFVIPLYLPVLISGYSNLFHGIAGFSLEARVAILLSPARISYRESQWKEKKKGKKRKHATVFFQYNRDMRKCLNKILVLLKSLVLFICIDSYKAMLLLRYHKHQYCCSDPVMVWRCNGDLVC